MIVLGVIVRIGTNLFQSLPSGVLRVRIGRGRGVWVRCRIRSRVWCRVWCRVRLWRWVRNRTVGLRTGRLALAELVADAPFVVVASRHGVRGLVAHRSALIRCLPRLLPIAWNVASTASWEASLVCAAHIAFSWQAEELEPLVEVNAATLGLGACHAALETAVDDVGCGSKVCADIGLVVGASRLKETSHHVVHAWLRVLGCHVEPDTCSHRQVSVFMHNLGLLEQVEFTVVGARGEHIGEHSVIVVPRELEGSSTIVLFAFSFWVGSASPATLIIITTWVVCAVATNFLHPVESLSPEFSFIWVSLASLLTPVSKYSSQFTSACVFKALSGHTSLVAKRGELGNGFKEVLVCVDWVSQRESIVPLLLIED